MLRNYVIPCINDEPFWNLKWWEWKICLYVIFWPFYPIQISSVSRINVSVDFIYLRRIFGQIPTFSNNFVGRVSLGNKSWSSASNYQRKSSSLSVEVWSAWGKISFFSASGFPTFFEELSGLMFWRVFAFRDLLTKKLYKMNSKNKDK